MYLIHWCYTIAVCMFKFTGLDGGVCPGISTRNHAGISVNLSRDLPSLGWQVWTHEHRGIKLGTWQAVSEEQNL